MRISRIRNDRDICYYHLINRVTGDPDALPFGNAEKEYLFKLIERMQLFYSVELISAVVMSNHLHAVCCAHPGLPDKNTVITNYRQFHGSRYPEPDWANPEVVGHYAARMRDVSCLMKDIQQRFTHWFNKRTGRRGRLWADRFKSVVLDGDKALWECVRYVEMNPLRAGICDDSGDYRFSTWGRYCGSGKHPFQKAFLRHIATFLPNREKETERTFATVADEFRAELARTTAHELSDTADQVQEGEKAIRRGVPFRQTITRRVRYWSDGAIIGSRSFVEQLSRQVFGSRQGSCQRFETQTEGGLVSFRRLRLTRTT